MVLWPTTRATCLASVKPSQASRLTGELSQGRQGQVPQAQPSRKAGHSEEAATVITAQKGDRSGLLGNVLWEGRLAHTYLRFDPQNQKEHRATPATSREEECWWERPEGTEGSLQSPAQSWTTWGGDTWEGA